MHFNYNDYFNSYLTNDPYLLNILFFLCMLILFGIIKIVQFFYSCGSKLKTMVSTVDKIFKFCLITRSSTIYLFNNININKNSTQ